MVSVAAVCGVLQGAPLVAAHADTAESGGPAKGTALWASAEARRTGKPVEVSALTTDTSLTEADPGGGYKLTISSKPERVRTSGGGWRAIDMSLKSADGGGLAPVASPAHVVFSAGGNNRLVRFLDRGRSMELTWPTTLPTPVVSDDTAEYRDVLPDVDLRVTADYSGFSEVLVVKTAEAAKNPALNEIRFGARTSGVTLESDGSNGVNAVAESGETVFHASQPLMWDSAPPPDAGGGGATGTVAPKATADDPQPGPGQQTKPMQTQVASDAVTVIPDKAMLTDPNTKFPVFVDPSFSRGRKHWGYIDQAYPSNVCYDSKCKQADGTAYPPRAGRYNSAGAIRSMFSMDTSPLPTGAKVITGDSNHRSTFSITGTWTPNWSCSTKVNVDLYLISGISGDETWNNFNDSSHWQSVNKQGTASGSYGHDGCGARTMEWNMIPAAQKAALNGWDFTTLGLRTQVENDSEQWIRMKLDPTLTIWYNRPPRVTQVTIDGKQCKSNIADPVLVGQISGRQAPLLKAQVTDPDGNNVVKTEFNWWNKSVTPPPTSPAVAFDTQARAPLNWAQVYAPPSGSLQDALWSVWVRSYDGNTEANGGYGAWFGPCYFLQDSTKPNVPAPTVEPVGAPGTTDAPVYSLDPDVWSGQPGKPGYFTFSVPAGTGATDVHHYLWSLGSATPQDDAQHRVAAGTDANRTSAPVAVAPSQGGPTRLNVVAVDAVGNRAKDMGTVTFNVGNLTCPEGSTQTMPGFCAEKAAGFWRMNENTSVTSPDASGKNHRMVFGSGTGWNDNGVRFQGGCGTTQSTVTSCKESTDDAASRVPVVRSDQSFTVSAWVKLANLPDQNMAIVSQNGDYTTGFSLHYVVDQGQRYWAFEMSNPDHADNAFQVRQARSTADYAPQQGEWTHLAGVYDAIGKHLYLYVNGRPMADHDVVNTSPADFAPGWNASGSLQVARSRWSGAFKDALDGWVSDVHVFPSAFIDTDDVLVTADKAFSVHNPQDPPEEP